MRNPIVFAGPSLFGIDAARLQGIDLRPPAGKGDLLAAALEGGRAIGLIDGTFEYGAAIWHKEILFALDRGIAIFGAASMGALRGAECAAFGMIGIGTVYEDYAAGRRQSDADVAVVHAPAALGYRPLSEALVDIDATLAHVREGRLLAPEMIALLSATARMAHFKNRTWPLIVTRAGYDTVPAAQILDVIQTHRVSAKTADALALIDILRASAMQAAPKSSLPASFNRTMFFEGLEQDVRARRAHEESR